jgi:type VI secretion system protein ImpK
MRLSDCFVDLFAYVSHAMGNPSHYPGSGEALCSTVSGLITQSETQFEASGCDRADYENARFAVFAWIDETVLKSAFEGKADWQRRLLQRTYYRTAGGGVEFFRKLKELDDEKPEVREVYYLCLALGFTGRYGLSEGDGIILDKVKEKQLKTLAGGKDIFSNPAQAKLFPSAYSSPGSAAPSEKPAKNVKGTLVSLLLGAGPVLVFVFMYVLYRFILNNEIMTTVVQ